MPRRGVFWSRPVTRAYTYNLNVGENYYAPLTDYLDSTDRSQRDSTPHYTFEERLIQKPIEGRRYEPTIDIDRYSRAKSLTRSDTLRNYSKKGNYLASELASCRAWRAASEMRAYSSRSSREPSLTRAPLINAAVDRYNRIDDRIHHQELISEVANRISMLEREKEYLTRQLNSSLLSRPTLWV